MKKKVFPVLDYNTIQEIRLSHSLMESEYEIYIPNEHEIKFVILSKKFGASYTTNKSGAIKLNNISISHSKPSSSIGSITRPLIFPHGIISHCRTMWPKDRPLEYSFLGLMTKKRKKVINSWIKSNVSEGRKVLWNDDGFVSVIKKKVKLLLGYDSGVLDSGNTDVYVSSSHRGRSFPEKSWDKNYYDKLLRSKFVLCPNGDYAWTYRFFEAVLCGAIPIVESECKLYQNFKFFTMNDDIEKMSWSKNIAKENYKKCSKMITVPTKNINEEISRQVKDEMG